MWEDRHQSKSLHSSLSHVSRGCSVRLDPNLLQMPSRENNIPACNRTQNQNRTANLDNVIDLRVSAADVWTPYLSIYSCVLSCWVSSVLTFLVLIKSVSRSTHQALPSTPACSRWMGTARGNICITLRWHGVSFDVGFSDAPSLHCYWGY